MKGPVKIRTQNSIVHLLQRRWFFVLDCSFCFGLAGSWLFAKYEIPYCLLCSWLAQPNVMEYLKKKKIVLLDHSLCKRHPDYPDHPDYSVFNWMIWIIWILHITGLILDFSWGLLIQIIRMTCKRLPIWNPEAKCMVCTWLKNREQLEGGIFVLHTKQG